MVMEVAREHQWEGQSQAGLPWAEARGIGGRDGGDGGSDNRRRGSWGEGVCSLTPVPPLPWGTPPSWTPTKAGGWDGSGGERRAPSHKLLCHIKENTGGVQRRSLLSAQSSSAFLCLQSV